MSAVAWRKYANFVGVWVMVAFALQAFAYYSGERPAPLRVPVAMAVLGALAGLISLYLRERLSASRDH